LAFSLPDSSFRATLCARNDKSNPLSEELTMSRIALSVLAHPDDAEFLCAGTLLRLAREHGWEIHIATMTPGDCGSAERSPDEISRIRRAEGGRAAAVAGGTYHCLEERDLQVFYSERPLEKVTRLLRAVRPEVVFTHAPADYMLDHEMTSTIVRAAAFAAPIPNFAHDQGHAAPLQHIPHLYYCDPLEGKDAMGKEIVPSFAIDISGVIDAKEQMLASHASQRDWLLKHHGMDQYLKAMRDWSSQRGYSFGVAFAEGFRQHLGHSYPQDNLLGTVLGALSPVKK
jgi:LmbE family N-acetylglucosaminyl deacetylase